MENSDITDLIITGASGVIGKALLNKLSNDQKYKVYALTRDAKTLELYNQFSNIKVIEIDLSKSNKWEIEFENNVVAINLAYSRKKYDDYNLLLLNNFIDICKKVSVKKFIHISTIDVCGRLKSIKPSELDIPKPYSDYAKEKYELEKVVIKNNSLAYQSFSILRSGLVFGPLTIGLDKIIKDILCKKTTLNYMRSIIYQNRSLNLVYIDNLLRSILFFIEDYSIESKSIYFVTDDDDPNNNYKFVEKYIIDKFKLKRHKVPPWKFHIYFLKLILYIQGKDNIEPMKKFFPTKLIEKGFQKKITINDGLDKYFDWYLSNKIKKT